MIPATASLADGKAGMKLSDAQKHALLLLTSEFVPFAKWRESAGYDYPRGRSGFGRTTNTLLAMGLVEKDAGPQGGIWRITLAGLSALKEQEQTNG